MTHLSHGVLGNARSRQITAENFAGLDDELDRTLDLRSHHPIRIKFCGRKNFAQHRLHLEIMSAHSLCHGIYKWRRRFVFDEKAAKFLGEELRTRRLFRQNIDDVVAVEVAAMTEKRFRPGVVLIGSKPGTLCEQIETVSGEGAGRFAHILLGIIADSDGEQFHQFACPIFVRMFAPALWQIEIDHHRGVPRHLFCEGGEVPERVTANDLVLQPHPIAVFYLVDAGGEVSMPEQRHFFEQRSSSRCQAGHPPLAQVQDFIPLYFSCFANFCGIAILLGHPCFLPKRPQILRVSPGRWRE